MEDVLLPLETFRKYFERDGNLPHKAKPHVDACKAAFTELQGEEGAQKFGGNSLRTFLSNVTTHNIWHVSPGVKVNLQQDSSDFTLEVVKQFLDAIVEAALEQLDLRFPESDVLNAFMIFDPDSYRNVQLRNLDSFGKAECRKLVAHFCSARLDQRLFDVDQARLEQLGKELKLMKKMLWTASQDQFATFESV